MGAKTSKSGFHTVKIRNGNIELKENMSIILFCDDEYTVKNSLYHFIIKNNNSVEIFTTKFSDECEILVSDKTDVCLYCKTSYNFVKIYHKQIEDDCILTIYV